MFQAYWQYNADVPVDSRLAEVQREVASWRSPKSTAWSPDITIIRANDVGAAVWDIRSIIGDMDPKGIGYYFDPGHTTAEGREGGWRISRHIAIEPITEAYHENSLLGTHEFCNDQR
jgi:hypothetical protein